MKLTDVQLPMQEFMGQTAWALGTGLLDWMWANLEKIEWEYEEKDGITTATSVVGEDIGCHIHFKITGKVGEYGSEMLEISVVHETPSRALTVSQPTTGTYCNLFLPRIQMAVQP